MPLFYQHNIDENTRLAIWKIEESEAFFLDRVSLQQAITHPYKRLQYLAARWLLPLLFPDFPLSSIQLTETQKPILPGGEFQFSLSHAGNYAAAIVSRQKQVGIDIELESPRIWAIVPKFLTEAELNFLLEWQDMEKLRLQLTTILWSGKEALFKWYGKGKVDFRRHMQLNGPVVYHSNERIQLPFLFLRQQPVELMLEARIFDPLVLTWVVT